MLTKAMIKEADKFAHMLMEEEPTQASLAQSISAPANSDQTQQELENFYKNLSDEDLARARAFFSDTPVNSSNVSSSLDIRGDEKDTSPSFKV